MPPSLETSPTPSPPEQPDSSGTQHGRITIRSVITGALLSLIVSIGFTYTRVAFLTTGMNSDFITAGAIFVFFGVTVLLNPCIRLVRPSWAFDRAELAVIYIMLIIASTIPTWGFAVSASNVTSRAWFSIFLGSMIKAALLKYGGVRLYLALRPFFLGMILGQITCAGFWIVIDLLAGGSGNRVPVFHHHY